MKSNSKTKIMQTGYDKKKMDFSKCSTDTFQVESIEVNRLGWAIIGGDNGLLYKYKVGEGEVPNLFSTIKVYYVIPTVKNGSIKRRVVRKWEIDSSDLASDEDKETLFEDCND